MVKNPISRELLLLAAVLLLAAGLRLGWPGLTEFKLDEAHLIELSFQMADGETFPVRGIGSSVGFPNFPMSVWLYALPLVVWEHVTAATLFTGLLNTLAVALCYWFVRRYWGWQAALAAALMYAVSPWAIYYSRKIWAQNLLPLFVMGWGVAGALALVEKRRRFLALHLLCAAVAFQIHLGAVSLLPATAVLLLIFRRRVDWRWLLAGIGGAVLTAVPFLTYLGTREGDPAGALSTTAFTPQFSLDALRHTVMINVGSNIHALAGPDAFRAYLDTVPDLTIVHELWGALMLAGLGWLAWQAWTRRGEKRAEAGVVVLVWALLPPLVFLWQVTPTFPHYFIATYPALYVAAGVAFARLARRATIWIRGAGWTVLAATAGAQVWVWLALLFFAGRQATPGGVGIPLRVHLQAVETAQTMLADTGAEEVLVAAPAGDPDTDEFAAVYDVLLRDVSHRLLTAGTTALFPAGDSIVLLHPNPPPPTDVYRAAATQEETVALRDGEGELALLALPGRAAPPPETPFAEPPLLANWVSLLGVDGPIVQGGEAVWRVHWRPGRVSGDDYHFFNHFLDDDGQRIAQADAAAFPAGRWQEGDVAVSRFVLPWPHPVATPLTVRIGMYKYPSLENVPLLDVAGNPYTDAYEARIGQ